MSEESNASGTGTLAPLNSGARAAIGQLSKEGALLAEAARQKANLMRIIDGLSWGSGSSVIRGSSWSPMAKAAFADFCYITRANAQIHVDMLGGKPYLNAVYYNDLCNTDRHFIRAEQINLGSENIALLRKQAEEAFDQAEKTIERAERLGLAEGKAAAGELFNEAARLLANARDMERWRAHYQPPAKASHVYETLIYRYVNGAPVDRIMAGEIDDPSPYVKVVRECNWAGTGDASDPIGNKDPELTSRTRSFRRTAARAFPAWMENREAEIKRAEEIIDAEFRIVEDDSRGARALLPDSTGQAVRATGEPAATNAAGAQDLPVEGEVYTEQPAVEEARHGTEPPAASFDHALALRGFFASLRDAGVSEDARKAWQKEHGLPASTKTWSAEDFARAHGILAAPQRAEFERGCEMLGIDAEEFASRHMGALPTTIRDYRTLNAAIRREADGGEELPL